MKIARIIFGIVVAILAFSFLINLAREQASWGTGGWTPTGRDHAGTMVAAMLISTLPFAILFVLSLLGSLMLFKGAAAYRTVVTLELVFAILLMLIAFGMGLHSIDSVRSVEALFEGAFFVLLEVATAILLFFFAFRSEPLRHRVGKIVKIVLGVLLLLMSLVTILALGDVGSMSRFETIRIQVVAVLVGYTILEFGGALTLLVTAFRRRSQDSTTNLNIV